MAFFRQAAWMIKDIVTKLFDCFCCCFKDQVKGMVKIACCCFGFALLTLLLFAYLFQYYIIHSTVVQEGSRVWIMLRGSGT